MVLPCLVAFLDGSSDPQGIWDLGLSAYNFPLPARVFGDPKAAVRLLKEQSVAMMVIFVNGPDIGLQSLLQAFQDRVGALSEHQAIVAPDPSPRLLALAYEYQVDQFLPRESWVEPVVTLGRNVCEKLAAKDSAEAKIIELSHQLRQCDRQGIQAARAELDDVAEYDYRAAFASGKAAEATGDLAAAISSFESASRLNQQMRAARTELGHVLAATGQIERSIQIFEKLELTNKYDPFRKADLAAVYLASGDIQKAQVYLKQAQQMGHDHSKVREAEAQVLLAQGKIEQSLALLDRLEEVGPLFASSLNDLGVKLSRAGKGPSALALYKKAHGIVRSDLKYKISLNAALACLRMGLFQDALKFLDRCQSEFGSSFEKLEKIRDSILKDIAAAPKRTG